MKGIYQGTNTAQCPTWAFQAGTLAILDHRVSSVGNLLAFNSVQLELNFNNDSSSHTIRGTTIQISGLQTHLCSKNRDQMKNSFSEFLQELCDNNNCLETFDFSDYSFQRLEKKNLTGFRGWSEVVLVYGANT